ncbi:radical SAM protein [Candidatus Woesearchaeota archaeon]|nr:radical SAM protein [Candidatus Woesearchaeota archaeon]
MEDINKNREIWKEMMHEASAKEIETRILPYAYERLSSGKFVVTGYFGGWVLLSEEGLDSLKSEDFYENKDLYEKLKNSCIIIDNENLDLATGIYSAINRNLFLQPSLHMINVTNTCNYRCRYCHAGVSQGKDFMSRETALKTLKFIFKSGGPYITIEFQGGECLLNWKIVKLVVEKSREMNKIFKKDLHICIVSNLSLLNEEKLRFLAQHDVAICTSIDGSREVHDANRRTLAGHDTFNVTNDKVLFVKDYYKKLNLERKVDVLATITRLALEHPKEIVDTYVRLGIRTLHLRPVQNFGDALSRWPELTYTPEEFYDFWVKAMEYVFELNKRGIDIMERGSFNIVCKVLNHTDPMYVELMSPTGMGRTALLYNFDGAVYSSDEGRMILEPVFKIGTVDQEPMEVLGSEDNINTWASSFLDLTCYNSPFRPWGGIHPVKVYQDQGTIIPNVNMHPEYRIYAMQCKYLFDKIAEDGFEKELFMKWAGRVIK